MVLEPATRIHQQRETGSMAFKEAVFTEAFDLLEDAFCESLVIIKSSSQAMSH